MKSKKIRYIIILSILLIVSWLYFKERTDLDSTTLTNGYIKWENELFYFELPSRFHCTKHVHLENFSNNENGFFTDGKATFYFSYNNLQASGPDKPEHLIDEDRGISGWKILKDTVDRAYRKQFYNIDSTASGYNWAGVYLLALDNPDHEILFALSVFDDDKYEKHQIKRAELQKILRSVRLK